MIPSRTRLVSLLCAVPVLAAPAPPAPAVPVAPAFDAAVVLGRLQVPVLMTFEKAPEDRPWPTQLDILGEEALQGVGRWDVSGKRAEVEALRRHLALPQAHWVVVGQGGRMLGSGAGPLSLSAFNELLQASGFVSPIQALRTFLKRVPDHLEARERLFQLLREQARALTAARFGDGAMPGLKQGRTTSLPAVQQGLPKAGLELKGAEDLRIWGGLYRELERAYASGDWLHRQHGMLAGGPLWEATSPLMRGLLRRHRPTLLAHLRETPWDVNLLRHWSWASVVLGEPLIPTFESLPPHPEMPKGAMEGSADWPGVSIQAALAFEARAMGDLARHGRVMISLWQQGGQWRAFDLGGTWLKRAWTDLALPGLESLLRAGIPEAGDIFFQDLGGHSGASERVAEAVALAERLGRVDVAREWQSRRLRPGLPVSLIHFPGLLVTTASRDPNLTYTPVRKEGQPLMTYGFSRVLLASRGGWEGARADRWRAFLGWGAGDTRWALLDHRGRLLLEGSEPMNPVEVQARVNALDLTLDPPLAYDKIRDPWLRHILMGEELGMILHGLDWRAGRGGKASAEANLDPWTERIRALDPLREAGLWRRPQSRFSWGSVAATPVEDARVVHPARAWVEVLEGELALRPRSQGLWSLWGQWVSLVPDPAFAALQARLERHPLDAEPWPPAPLIEQWLCHARARGQWAVVLEVAGPRWEEAIKAAAEPQWRGSAWGVWQTLGLPLAEALLQQGRGEEADRVLLQVEALGMDRETAVGRAHAYPLLRGRWKPPVDRS